MVFMSLFFIPSGNSMKIIKACFLFCVLFLSLFIVVRSVHLKRLERELVILVRANQAMSHFHGMSYDLTGLGPLISFSVNENKEFKISYVKIVSGKKIYERSFGLSKKNLFTSLDLDIKLDDVNLVAVVEISEQLMMFMLFTVLCISVLVFLLGFLAWIIHSKKKAYVNFLLAAQVAHDIRSPLIVLQRLEDEISDILPEQKMRLKMSVSRIDEITRSLLKVKKDKSNLFIPANLLLDLESVINEKVYEYEKLTTISITKDFSQASIDQYSSLTPGLLKRIISNLINNAVESLSDKEGWIEVKLYSEEGSNIIEVKDNGLGIPIELKDRVFVRGYSSKLHGNGFGLSGAKEELDKIGGRISFESNEGKGTVFKVEMPQVEHAPTFLGAIDIDLYDKVIVVDDDLLMHKVWLKKLEFYSTKLEFFSNTSDLHQTYSILPSRTLLLVDHDFPSEHITGIEVVTKFSSGNVHAVLVTNRYDDTDIQKRCSALGVGILPKPLIAYLQINKNSKLLNSLIVLIDDDPLIRFDWKSYSNSRDINFMSFSSVESFINDSKFISKDSKIFIDSSLGNGLKGEIESEKLFDLGFKNLFLSTGFEASQISVPAWIKGTYSKNPRKIF